MKTKLSKTTKIALAIIVCVWLVGVGFAFYVLYGWYRELQFDAASSGMRCQVCADIIDPLENKYKIRECTVGVHSDDSVELRIELNPKDQAQAFDIAREVYDLKKGSPVLGKKPLELKMWVHDPSVDGQRIVYLDPDSRYGVNLHIYMPGAPNHKKKADLEEYLELTRKWEKIHRQKEMEKRRAAAENAEGHSEDAPVPGAEKPASE